MEGIWKVIRGWLDPVVAGKVHFTNNKSELEEFIEPSQIIKELGGDQDWEYEYVEPLAGENDKMKDTATRDSLLKTREETVKQFEAATLDWIKKPGGEEGKAARDRREKLATELKEGYWKLDPHIRARSLYDRMRIIQPDGKITWTAAKAPESAAPGAPETSTDDLD